MKKKQKLANLPTRIEQLAKLSEDYGRLFYLKRDDETGIELSGNKVRKLEYALQEALEQGCDTIITCGGVQSNHCRATAAACVKLGLDCLLFLSTPTRSAYQGNYLLDGLLGAEIRQTSYSAFSKEMDLLMEEAAKQLARKGKKAYLIPLGASNGIGTFGYFEAFEEILKQEEELGLCFDTLVCALGSGGTFSGLHFANVLGKHEKKVIGIPITGDPEFFKDRTLDLWKEFSALLDCRESMKREDILILESFAGRGYALNTPEEMDFIMGLTRREGIFFDSVYTGKALRGLLLSLKERHPLLEDSKCILFIHTGGLYGIFPKAQEFDFEVGK